MIIICNQLQCKKIRTISLEFDFWIKRNPSIHGLEVFYHIPCIGFPISCQSFERVWKGF